MAEDDKFSQDTRTKHFVDRQIKEAALKARKEKKEQVHDTQENKYNVYDGKKFFAADIGIPTLVEDYGGGAVGGNEYEDAMFHYGPRGKNKPKITDKAVVKLPDLNDPNTYRGHHDTRRPDGTMASEDVTLIKKTGPWSKEEDDLLREMVASEPDGVRGRWTRISRKTGRSASDCGLRWNQVLNPNIGKAMPDILRDTNGLDRDGSKEKDEWWKRGGSNFDHLERREGFK